VYWTHKNSNKNRDRNFGTSYSEINNYGKVSAVVVSSRQIMSAAGKFVVTLPGNLYLLLHEAQ
jgi:mRNA degradation ribonuclease J1/J2